MPADILHPPCEVVQEVKPSARTTARAAMRSLVFIKTFVYRIIQILYHSSIWGIGSGFDFPKVIVMSSYR